MMQTNTEKNPTLIKIGEKVKMLRKSIPKYANYEHFAWQNNINKITVYRIESGHNYKLDSLLRVLDALDVKLSDFFSDID